MLFPASDQKITGFSLNKGSSGRQNIQSAYLDPDSVPGGRENFAI